MRTVYLGTSEFAATVLRRLAGTPHRPSLVVTPPDRRQGRGRKVKPPPAAVAAEELGLDLMQVESVSEERVHMSILMEMPKVVVVCAFGQLIREPLLHEFPILNVHPSLLPRWRGAAPIERAMMAGDPVTGVCVMRLTEGLDSGPVALREETPIDPEENFAALSARLADLGSDLLVRALDLKSKGLLQYTEQDENGVTYAEKIESAERRLDPGRPAGELAAKVRALNPHIGTYLELPGIDRLGVRRAHAVEAELEPGRLEASDGALLLGCGDGALQLDEVQPPGGKPMPADAYLRGHPLRDR